MIPIIVYPVPLDNWNTFRPAVMRFTETMKEFPPGCPYVLIPVFNWGTPVDDIRSMFYGLKCQYDYYFSDGADAGSWQHVALRHSDRFLICLTTRCYFFRAGWLYRLVQERKRHGPGLYTTSASHEGGTMHACLRAFGVDAEFLANYQAIESRDQGTHFEADGTFMNFVENNSGTTKLVLWDHCLDKPEWFSKENRFRNGNQEQMLVWDRHSDAYKNASPEEKQRLERMANPP